MKDIIIEKAKIGGKHKPFIIAEMSGNHNHSLKKALQIVDAAAKSGVDALKIQTYTADTMTLDINARGFLIKDPKSPWKGTSLYKLYKKAYTPWEWHKPIFDRCRKLGILGFSTPFDETAVDFLESLNVPCYKIASFENVDLPLIRRVALTGKPVLISTGLASLKEIGEAVAAARKAGCQNIVLLKCTSSYPASPKDSNLMSIPDLEERFKCTVGLSDHTLGIGAALASVALGAAVIEKHFTLSRAAGGVDAAFSLEPKEMRDLVIESERAWRSLGKVKYGPTSSEKKSLIFRRSIYAVKNLKAGEKFTRDNIRRIRPGLGLPPKYYEELLGRKVKRAVKRGTPLSWGMVD